MTGCGASGSATIVPGAEPGGGRSAPITASTSAVTSLKSSSGSRSTSFMASSRAAIRPGRYAGTTGRESPSGWLAPDLQHALHGRAGAGGDLRVDLDAWRQGQQRVVDVIQRDPLHVRAQVARAHELDVRRLGGDVVRHGAFRNHQHLARALVG